MVDEQAARTLSSESADPRIGPPAPGMADGSPARAGTAAVGTLVRSDRPISPELGAFLTRQLAAARASDAGATPPATAATLATLLAAPEPWPVDLSLDLLQRVAALLDDAEAAGVVLGTFTPSCVVLSGRYLVLARPDARAGVDPDYVAPEQLRRGATVDGRASQYGLALLAATLLGGTQRFGLLGALRGRSAGPRILAPECLRAMRRVVLAARDPDPARRFGSAEAFVTALGAACGAWALAEPERAGVVTPTAARRVVFTGGMLGVAAVAGAMGWYGVRRPVVIPPELANNIAMRRVVTEPPRTAPVADPGVRAVNDQDDYRLLMAAAPDRDSVALAAAAAAAHDSSSRSIYVPDTPRLPVLATAIALPRVEPTRDARRAATTTATEFAAGGVVQSLRRDLVGGEGTAERGASRAASDGAPLTAPALVNDGFGPAYPTSLLQTHLAGEVVVRFVIDSAGHVDPGTFQLVRSSHVAFTNAVRESLGRLQYRPAERGGRHVSAAVEQRFTFAVPTR